MKKIFFLTLCFGFSCFVTSQVIKESIDSLSGGSLHIEMEEGVNKLLEKKEICKEISKKPSGSTPISTSGTAPKPVVIKKTAPVTTDICANANKIAGFTINVASAKDEKSIDQTLNAFRGKFPTLRTEKSFNRPEYRLLAGDFFTKNSAQSDLRAVRKTYPSAVVIPWRIWCNRAK